MKGRVYLVGAGPGDPELLTLKALRILRMADIVLHDDLVTPEILQIVPPAARVHNVGKRCGAASMPQPAINAMMIKFARSGLDVVRLKGGDPMIFGRAGEEIAALRAAGIRFEVVPGVTAASGAAAAAGITLTQRHLAPAVALVTYSRAAGATATNWRAILASCATAAVYMPGDDYGSISRDLSDAGMNLNTACLLVSNANTPAEQIHATTVKRLPNVPPLPSPTILIIGDVANQAVQPAPADTKDVSRSHQQFLSYVTQVG